MEQKESRRIVLTGATGFIGGHVARLLVQRGDHVIAFSRDPAAAKKALPDGVEHVMWSSSSTDGEWRGKLDGADGVVNLAGYPIAGRWTEERKRKMYDSRINGTRNLVDAMARAEQPPRVLVSGSAVGYYGFDPDGIMSEEQPAGADLLARLVVDWEREAQRAEEQGVRVVTVRTGLVLGNDGGLMEQVVPPFKWFVGGPISSGRQWWPWIHIDDETGIILWALDNDEVRGPLNAVAPGVVDNRTFSTALGRALHRPSILPVPELALKLLFGEGSAMLTGGQNALPKRTVELGYQFQFATLGAALADLY